ncbi:hypothetical protein BKA61DRAFT_611480 [Leptodontidium sp. MPI-SDFR-AT-0119]|nr:hypothetical protein BKA61DRAFT_611480 [Leptodontidium sp. MPI-SDFR-AT-0119]
MPPSKPFACDVCCRAFTRSENLDRHKKTHHGEGDAENFECTKCKAQFARRDVCKRHMDRCSGAQAQTSRPRKRPRTSLNVNSPPTPGNDEILVHAENLDVENGSPESRTIDPPLSPLNLPPEEIANHVESYFSNFHPALPILHRPSFSQSETTPIMLKIMVAIGSLYSGRRKVSSDSVRLHQMSQDLWRSGSYELGILVMESRQRFRTNWVLQSWILYTVYGTFSGDDQLMSKSRKMYRFLTDAVRELDLLHQKAAIPTLSLWSIDLNLDLPFDEPAVYLKWHQFITQESLKLSIYAFYFFDYHLLVSCNARPSVSSIEFEWELPNATPLWEADSASSWWQLLHDDHLSLEAYRADYLHREPDTKSLLAATQSLLSANTSLQLISLLTISPFAALCIVSNLERLVRDFTRCYYQLPPTLSDPNPFHVLTQAQNSQVSAALGLILGAAGNSPCTPCSQDCQSLWHAVRLGCLSTKISLGIPDDLLVGGVVESNPTAGLATATHLTLGNYVTTRRSGLSVDETTLNILGETLKVMHEMATPDRSAPWEGPWTSTQAFRMLLILWRILRLSITQMQSDRDPLNIVEYPTHFRPAKTVIEGVIAALRLYSDNPIILTLSSNPEKGADQWEDQYMQWMHQICDRRDVWDVGLSMTKVLEEIYDTESERSPLRL